LFFAARIFLIRAYRGENEKKEHFRELAAPVQLSNLGFWKAGLARRCWSGHPSIREAAPGFLSKLSVSLVIWDKFSVLPAGRGS